MESIGRGELVSLLFEDTKDRIQEQLCVLSQIGENNEDIDLGEVHELIAILDEGLTWVWEDQLNNIDIGEF